MCYTVLMTDSPARRPLPDLIRGVTFLSMLAYHTMWDLVYLFHVDIPWYPKLPGYVWQQSICITFIALSGYSVRLGHRTLRRGYLVFGAGALVSAVTFLFMRDALIVFGILTLIGSAMLLAAVLQKPLQTTPPAAGAICSFALFLLTRNIRHFGAALWMRLFPASFASVLNAPYHPTFAGYLSAYLGIPPASFFSTDYFPLLPWVFLFFTGYFAYDLLRGFRKAPLQKRLTSVLGTPVLRPLSFLGRHTLPFYLLHQPVIYLVLHLLHALSVLP